MRLRKLSPLLLVLSSSCLLADDPDPFVDLRLDALTQYNHRGMVQNETGVVQGEMNVNLAAAGDSELDLRAWANLDLDSDTGDSWFPDGHGGEVTEAQYSATFSRQVNDTTISFGIFNYSLLNGSEFQQNDAMLADPRGPTTEVFARIAQDLSGLVPAIIVHYDIDEVEDFYVEGNLRYNHAFSESVTGGIEGHIGWSGEDHSEWAYGVDEEGFSDWRVGGDIAFAVSENMTLRGMIAYGQIYNIEIRDWFDDDIGIDDKNLWGGVGITWSF